MPDSAPSRRTLERALYRSVRFLNAAARNNAIRRQLAYLGFDREQHDFGWAIVKRVLAFNEEAVSRSEINAPVDTAVTALDVMDGPVIVRIRAALEHLHPEVAKYFLHDLKAQTGPNAIMSMTTIVERMRALKNGPDRADFREIDHAALETLAKRGFDDAWLAEVTDLIEKARTYADIPDEPEDDAIVADLVALHRWITDWSSTARAGITSRRHLIALGAARRRTSVKEEPDDAIEIDDPVVEEPPPVA